MRRTQGWSLVVLDIHLDLTTAAGRMMARTVINFAEYERELISERTKAGLAAKKRRGEPDWSATASQAGGRAANRVGAQQRPAGTTHIAKSSHTADGILSPAGRPKVAHRPCAASTRVPRPQQKRRAQHETPTDRTGVMIAYIRPHHQRKRKGKAVKRYEVCWREPAMDSTGLPTGKPGTRQESYPTRELAEARRDELNNAKHTLGGTSALANAKKAGELPFGHYATRWIAQQHAKVAAGKLTERTADDYADLLSRYVLGPDTPGRFGAKAVGAITSLDCEAFLADLAGAGLARRTVTKGWGVLSAVLRYAARHNAIPASPADAVDRGEVHAVGDHQPFEHHPLSAGQVAAFAAKVAERYPVYGLLVLFLAYTGLRAGEAAGLEVRDVTLTTGPDGTTKGAVRVQRTKTAPRRVGYRHAQEQAQPSHRTLTALLATRLRTTFGRYTQMCRTARRRTAGTPMAEPATRRRPHERATRRRGPSILEPCDFDTLQYRVLRPAMEAVGLTGVRLHDLRHTFAALQLSAGTHYMQVSRWLGHASYVVTMTAYAEWLPDEDAGNTLPEPVAAVAETNVVKLFA